jgi:hypothetical protein
MGILDSDNGKEEIMTYRSVRCVSSWWQANVQPALLLQGGSSLLGKALDTTT